MRNKKLLALLISLVGLLVASSSFSVAWFATQDFLQIDGLDVTLSGDGKLLISTENKEGTFVDHLGYDKLQRVINFLPVSSMMSNKWMANEKKFPVFYDQYNQRNNLIVEGNDTKYGVPYETTTNDGVFSQELFLLCEQPYYAYINSEKTTIVPNYTKNRETAKEIHDKGISPKSEDEIYEALNSLINCIRFSILIDTPSYYDYKIIDPYKNANTPYGGILDSNLSGSYDTVMDEITEEKFEVLYGEVNDRNLLKYKPLPNEPISYEGEVTCFDSSHDVDAFQIDFEKSKQNGLVITDEASVSLEENKEIFDKIASKTATEEEINSVALIPLEANTPTRIVLSIYLEGWDRDNINSTMGGSFLSTLAFGVIDKQIL